MKIISFICGALLALGFTGCAADPVSVRRSATAELPLVIFNNDGGDAYLYPAKREFSIDGFLKLRTAQLPETAVGVISYCTITSSFGQFTHPTKYGEFLDIQHQRPGAKNVTPEFVKLGTDPLREQIRFARENELKIFWCNRMNDTHDAGHRVNKPYERYSRLKQQHPEYLCGAIGEKLPFGLWSAVDFAHPEIRDLAVSYFTEVVDNYDVDGVEMDFFRHFYLFKSVAKGEYASAAEREMLLDMLRRIRSAIDAAAAKRGRPILIAMRVPDSPEYCRAAGLDLEQILREKLVDVIIGAGYFQLRPWKKWAELADKYGVRSYASIAEPRIQGTHAMFNRRDAMVWRARAAAALANGVDGIYIFNQFDLRRASQAYATELRDPEAMMRKNKYYVATYLGPHNWGRMLRDGAKFNELPAFNPKNPLKLDGKVEVPMETGENSTPLAVYVTLQAEPADAVTVKLNGKPAKFAADIDGVSVWKVDPEVLDMRNNTVTLRGKAKVLDCGLLVVHDFNDKSGILKKITAATGEIK